MSVYYEDEHLKVIQNEQGLYDMYDAKFGGRMTYANKTKDEIDVRISAIKAKRSTPCHYNNTNQEIEDLIMRVCLRNKLTLQETSTVFNWVERELIEQIKSAELSTLCF